MVLGLLLSSNAYAEDALTVNGLLKEGFKITKEELIQVLIQPRNAITKQFQKLFELNEIKLEFTDSAYAQLVEHVTEMELGARGLRSVLEMQLLDLQYNIFESRKKKVVKIIVDDEFFKSGKEPQYIYAKETKSTKK